MQTFLPFPDFTLSASVLDNKRLGKQRVECVQILKALLDPDYGWQNHPAVKMWRGHEWQLCNYGIAICDEWIYNRFYIDNCKGQIEVIKYHQLGDSPNLEMPWWFGNKQFHLSHRVALYNKNYQHYRNYFKDSHTFDKDMPYWWPTEFQPKENAA